MSAVLAWLEKNVERTANGPKSIVHGDLGFHNSLYEDGELRVILDWELSHIGSPAYDLGYLRNAITDNAMWSDFMAAYSAAGGPYVEPFLVDYYNLFGGVWFYQLVLQSQAALSAGMVRDITIVAACADILPPIMEGMARSFRRSIAWNSYYWYSLIVLLSRSSSCQPRSPGAADPLLCSSFAFASNA